MKLKISLATARFLYRTVHRFGSIFFDLDSFDQTADARVFEYSFVIGRLSQLPIGKVLDVGCSSRSNVLAPALASLGWKVYGIDTRQFNLTYPGFQFVQGDVTKMDFPEGFFDAVYTVSTLEHMGLSGRYGIQKNDFKADFKAIKEIKRVLKPEGHLIITVPYGRGRIIRSWARIYNENRLKQLLNGWSINNQIYFIRESSGNGLLVTDELNPEADFDKNEATILLDVSPKG